MTEYTKCKVCDKDAQYHYENGSYCEICVQNTNSLGEYVDDK